MFEITIWVACGAVSWVMCDDVDSKGSVEHLTINCVLCKCVLPSGGSFPKRVSDLPSRCHGTISYMSCQTDYCISTPGCPQRSTGASESSGLHSYEYQIEAGSSSPFSVYC